MKQASTISPALRRRSLRVVLTLALAYGSGLWLVLVHHASGATEHAEPPLLLHWLRDSSAAVPLVALAVWAGTWVTSRRRHPLRHDEAGQTATLGAATTVACCTAYVLGAGNPLHAFLAGGEEHGGEHLPALLHAVRDGLVALAVCLPIAIFVMALMAPDRQQSRGRSGNRKRRSLLRPGLAVALMMGLLSTVHAPVSAATGTSGSPCPEALPSAQRKEFKVQALDVKIPLNRFGDNDPVGKMYVLDSMVSAVRAQEKTQEVSIGLRDDAIQPLSIRANAGDCVTIIFTNKARGGSYGMHIDGLAFAVDTSSGDRVGANADTAVAKGQTATYTYYVPLERSAEGTHYIHPGPGYRSQVDHGLFGGLTVEPPGSTYLNATTGQPLASGWEAIIVPGMGKSFREAVKMHHEVGNDTEKIRDRLGNSIDLIDPTTGSYRPGSFALNYRSEPFKNRLLAHRQEKAHAYSSYTFGDPSTPMPRGYLGDPTKFRILHAGGEKFHVYHLHGGGDRWRFNPVADTTYDYGDTGLNKKPVTKASPSSRLDSQSFGPGESYNLEIEGGAGGVQQSAGDFLFHCHIAKHYVSGMWSFWRVYDTLQADLQPLPDRTVPPEAVDSTRLIGTTVDGTAITAANLDGWIRPQLPAQGVSQSSQDGSVLDWVGDVSNPSAPYLGEPEDLTYWADSPGYYGLNAAHPNRLQGDQMVGDRPKILFNPLSGRPAYPLLRTHIGKRPPFTGNGHSGAPYLGENADKPATGEVNPWVSRRDGLCPAGAPLRTFNVVAIEKSLQRTRKGEVDLEGKLFVLAQDKQDVMSGRKPAEPLAIRSNLGDCDAVTLTNEIRDDKAFDGFSKATMHIHHVQFDVQGSDGVTTGFAYEHSVRPFTLEDPTLTQPAPAGATTLTLSNTAKFQPGVWIGIGLGTNGIEIRQIASIAGDVVTLTQPLAQATPDKPGGHAAGEFAGTEFVQYRWYPDVLLDNIFWHDHVDGIHGWGHGLVGQLIIEPPGSTYHDPTTGAEVASGTIVDIHTTSPLIEGIVDGSFREMALWTIDDNDREDYSTLNLRAEPLKDRGNQAEQFSSYRYGDPYTPLPRAYPGDPIVIRTINVSPTVDTLHVAGGRFTIEPRYIDSGGQEATLTDTIHYLVSEKYTLVFDAGGPRKVPGDYLYFNGDDRRLRQGAWGLIRVLAGRDLNLQELPSRPAPSGPTPPRQTGNSPPALPPGGPSDPCPAAASAMPHRFAVSAVDIPGAPVNASRAFVPTSDVAAVRGGALKPEPLALHVAAGECVQITFRNDQTPDPLVPTRPAASFMVGELDRNPDSSGVNIGFTPQQNVAPGQSRTYLLYADTDRLGSATIADMATTRGVKQGLYGALVVAPAGATFTDPATGEAKDVGTQVDVHAGNKAYRDFTVVMADDDPRIGQDFMPYPLNAAAGKALINYRAAPSGDGATSFALTPPTPLLRAYAGDPVEVHAIVAPGSEQPHVFSLGGLSWAQDSRIHNAQDITAQGMGPWETFDAVVTGGAGGRAQSEGDFFYGDLRRPFTKGGLWGLQRVLPPPMPGACPLRPLYGTCSG